MKLSRRWIAVMAGVVAVAGIAVLAWLWWPKGRDATAAVAANLRGVGLMEQFDYAGAADAFAEAGRLDPNWVPARVNLGIALFNTTDPAKVLRAREIFGRVLAAEPDNIHAHYCLGIIDLYDNLLPDAHRHFDAVRRLDDRDAHTWLHLGLTHPAGKESAEAKECFERALKLDPYLNAARYNLAQHPVGRDLKRTKELLAEHAALMRADWETPAKMAYTEMGRYAEVIGRAPASAANVGPLPLFAEWEGFAVKLAAGTMWAKGEPLGGEHLPGGKRFGATILLLDFNRDGRPDMFLPSATDRGDLLLRNDGEGAFTDVTAEAGITGASLGGAVGDYDNDGFPDLLLTGETPRLFRNRGDGRYADETAALKLTGRCLGAAWTDLDQDGDLDLIVAGPTGFVVLLNAGEAPAVDPGKQVALTTRFERWAAPKELPLDGKAVAVALADLDDDRDVDWLCLTDGKAAFGVSNDRLLRFRPAGDLGEAADWNGALVLDADHDHRSDLLLLPHGKPPQLWLSRAGERPIRGTTNGPALAQAQAIDLDRDGWTDVVGLSDGRPVLLQNDGTGKLVHRNEAFGPAEGASGVAAVDLDGDGHPDLVMRTEGKGLAVRRNNGNGNHTLRLELSGKRGTRNSSLHTNADGFGAWVVAQAGPLWTGQERTTLHAGLGQSCLPVELGLGKHRRADVVRIRWPDGLPQAELSVAAGATVKITETNRKSTSCPVLFAWDGQRFRFVTDFLGGGALGEMGADGSTRPPRPEESLALDGLAADAGWYRIKVTEPMDEVVYLDHLELVVIDHPAGWVVLPDERFTMTGPPPTQELLFLTDTRSPMRARDDRGDVAALLRDVDRRMVDRFRVRSWLGYAEEHTLELDFGPVKEGRWVLCLNGWTDYPYPESIWAAEQAKVPLTPPTLEVPVAGVWQGRGELGFPAGLPRTMTREVSGLIAEGGRFRIRTNMQVYWDRVTLARRTDGKEARVTALPVGRATLRQRGLLQEVTPDGRGPIAYDHDRTEAVAISPWKGRLTRLGDVAELLRRRDDRFAIAGPGDEIEVGFDARRLPGLPAGWARSFVLRTAGYSKDSSPFTLTGTDVEPLPYRAMAKYPPPARDAAQAEYDRRWNTRR